MYLNKLPISNLQLQKILYYIQKAFLDLNGTVAFSDNIEAWQFGPVVPNVYYRYCGNGVMPISISRGSYEISLDDQNIINPIVEEKRTLDPWTLVAETHKKDGAWDRVYKQGSGNRQVIPIDLIKKFG